MGREKRNGLQGFTLGLHGIEMMGDAEGRFLHLESRRESIQGLMWRWGVIMVFQGRSKGV